MFGCLCAEHFAGCDSDVKVKTLPGELDAFLPFVSDGFVSLVGSEEKVPVRILRDTAAFDSFI